MTRRLFGAALTLALAAGTASAQNVLINGAGATFPYPMYSKWFDEYHKKFPTLQFNYQSIGSGGGIQQVTQGTVDFGATDGPMTDMQLKEFAAKHGGSGILHFPTVMGADVPAYNIAGVSQALNFTPEALAGIFLGKITKWNDPELMKANPGVNLPAKDIIVVHRSDGSGTTYVWVDYLSKISKEWETKVGRGTSVNWPVGLGGKGNEGVAGQIQQTPNSIGYIELIYAVQNKISYGKVKNVSGAFVEASLASVTAAAAGAMKEMPDDFRVSITKLHLAADP
jgi:phosphate transport system substrate-binding protein